MTDGSSDDKLVNNDCNHDQPVAATAAATPVTSKEIEASLNPVCSLCQAVESIVWFRNEDNNIVCKKCTKEKYKSEQRKAKALEELSCNEQRSDKCGEGDSFLTGGENGRTSKVDKNSDTKEKASDSNENETPGGPTFGATTRKSTRKSKFKQNHYQNKPTSTKGKGRRSIFKKCVYKSPSAVITPITSDAIFHKGQFYQSGDIVSMTDFDGSIYYAQIRGFLQDQYCEKSAAITWLLPTQSSPRDYFDPSTYILGPEEDVPRKLECMKFICNCPSDYFKAKNCPYLPVKEPINETGFISTRLGPCLYRKTSGTSG